jgi:glycosyltransferase involved in cell wall biosynthesis
MKILMTADTIGGVWTYAVELSAGLCRQGAIVALAAMGGRPDPVRRGEALEYCGGNLRLFEAPYKLEWMEDPWQDVEKAGEWLLDIARSFGPDIVHLNNYAHGALDWGKPPVLIVGHSCVLSWWEAVKAQPVPPEWGRYRAVVKEGLSKADAVVAPSRTMLKCLEKYYGPLSISKNTSVIANGRSGESFRPLVKEPFVFSAGRLWDEGKNIRCLAGAAPGIPWPVYVAGEDISPPGAVPTGGCPADKPQALKRLGRISSGKAMAAWLGRASIFAYPARYEPFGLSVLEAALSGCALVLGDIPTLRELWDNAALFVSPNDTKALGSAIESLIRDEALRERLASASRGRALTFSPGRMAGQYLSLYSGLLQRKSGTRVGVHRDTPRCA